VLPVHGVLDAEDDVVGAAHFGDDEAFGFAGRVEEGALLGLCGFGMGLIKMCID